MRSVIDERYIMSVRETVILLKSLGYKKCYGIITESIGFKESEAGMILNGLMKKEIIDSDGEAFQISRPYRDILEQMGEAEYIIVCHNRDWEHEFSLYVGNEFLKCKQSSYQQNIYLFNFIDNDKLKDEFLSEEVIPKNTDEEEINQKMFDARQSGALEDSDELLKIIGREKNVKSVTEIINNKTDELMKIIIVKEPLYCYMISVCDNDIDKQPYTEQGYLEKIQKATGGKLKW